jgi:hypothetical protein
MSDTRSRTSWVGSLIVRAIGSQPRARAIAGWNPVP